MSDFRRLEQGRVDQVQTKVRFNIVTSMAHTVVETPENQIPLPNVWSYS